MPRTSPNFSRSQNGGNPITLDDARRMWQRQDNPLYNGIQLLYAATEHLIELRQRLFISFAAFAITPPVAMHSSSGCATSAAR